MMKYEDALRIWGARKMGLPDDAHVVADAGGFSKGCDTCDYGSGIKVIVWDESIEPIATWREFTEPFGDLVKELFEIAKGE